MADMAALNIFVYVLLVCTELTFKAMLYSKYDNDWLMCDWFVKCFAYIPLSLSLYIYICFNENKISVIVCLYVFYLGD